MNKTLTVTARNRGYTLLEVMVACAILAILATIALPSLGSMLRNSQADGAANGMLASVRIARIEAIKSSNGVTITPIDRSGNWSHGWCIVPTNAADCDDPAAIGRYEISDAQARLTVSPQTNLITFQRDGTRLRSGATPLEFRACTADGLGRAVTISLAGVARYLNLNGTC